MGANQSAPIEPGSPTALKHRPKTPRLNSTNDISTPTKKVCLDELLKSVSPSHPVSECLSSRIDKVTNLPPPPMAKIQRLATMKLSPDGKASRRNRISPEKLSMASAEVIPFINRRSLIYASRPGLSTRIRDVTTEQASIEKKLDDVPENPLSVHNMNNDLIVSAGHNGTATKVCDIESLGAFKPGTLRIVNGCPSPAPSSIFPSIAIFDTPDSDQISKIEKSGLGVALVPEENTSVIRTLDQHSPHTESVRQTSGLTPLQAKLNSLPVNTESEERFTKTPKGSEQSQRGTILKKSPLMSSESEIEALRAASHADKANDTAPGSQSRSHRARGNTVSRHLHQRHLEDLHASVLHARTLSMDKFEQEADFRSVVSIGRSDTSSTLSNHSRGSSHISSTSTKLSSVGSQSARQESFSEKWTPITHEKDIVHPQPANFGRIETTTSDPVVAHQNRADPFLVKRQNPRSLEKMLFLSSRPTDSGVSSDISFSGTTLNYETIRARHALNASEIPPNYVPFEPIVPETRASPVKFYRSSSHRSRQLDQEDLEFGMRLQKPKPLDAATAVRRFQASSQKVVTQKPATVTMSRIHPSGPRPMMKSEELHDVALDAKHDEGCLPRQQNRGCSPRDLTPRPSSSTGRIGRL